ncbi:SusE domain-containing protein [Ferruginibacter paludis]|uniref:SusE domain-containing protein n=1 Tax=Ferruginibacter paludis TaxID=1310417 RepID=UPI0025B6101C|nr:SusE domain-containing protein [Ferruginibacter paludis]MDN3659257.1 SusE domain-containing protein [Ferruginibacter paludis]
MKKIVKSFFLFSMLGVVFTACKKDENKVYFEGGTSPVLSSSVTASTLPLSFANKDNAALNLSWTNPNYMFNTGVSSQDVSYQVEIDTTGANFTSTSKQTVSVSKDLSKSFLVSEFNGYLLNQLVLTPGVSHNIELRVKSFLGNNSAGLYSNVLKYKVTPYAIPPVVEPPTNGTLWLTGDATASGYANPLLAPYDASQKFKMVSATLYELTVTMKGGGAYKLIQEQGKWDTQYHMKTGGTWDAGDFEKKDSDPGFAGPAAAGSYKIAVDFQRGKYAVTKL